MVRVAGIDGAKQALKASAARLGLLLAAAVLPLLVVYTACTARVKPSEFGVEQRKFGFTTGIMPTAYGPGLYFVPPGATMYTFPRGIHVLEASYDRAESKAKASPELSHRVDEYFDKRAALLGQDHSRHRVVDAINVQTSDGYAVTADVTLLYSIEDPVLVAKKFGWGSLYVDSFCTNTFRNGVLVTLGKMNAESFYDAAVRIKALEEAESVLRTRFKESGFKVEKLLLRGFRYADSYEKSLRDKKVAVQLAEKNRKESLVNEEKARLQQIESKGDAAITIAESEMKAKVAKIRAEAQLYSSQTRARADKEVNVAAAEAKRLKADALTQAGGRYVVALEAAKMFDNIEAAVMTPEQYIAFVRNAWILIGVNPGGPVAAPAGDKK